MSVGQHTPMLATRETHSHPAPFPMEDQYIPLLQPLVAAGSSPQHPLQHSLHRHRHRQIQAPFWSACGVRGRKGKLSK